jgi:tetrahydromethanopterin S-methyltransferase subunit G
MTKDNKSPDKDQAKEAQRILDRVNRESETIATSSIARTSDQFRKHISGNDGNADDNDPVEVLGKKIGRTLGWLAVIFLIIFLLRTYLF